MKNRLLRLTVIVLLICSMLLSACGTEIAQDPPVSDDTELESSYYADEMDSLSVLTVSISADPAAWQEMLDNATAEEYIPADVTINGTTITNVGIRPKGNSSLSSIARDESTDRYSFKIKFDEYVDGQTWLGLDKLVLNNNYSDATSMKEYISYDIMTYIGVDAPLYSYADISVNGKSWGFYLAVEDIDSGYLERVKGDEGELYKPESMEMGGEMMGEIHDISDDTQQEPPNGDFIQRGGGMGMGNTSDGGSLVYTDDDVSSYSDIFDNAETKTDEADHQRVIEAIKNLNEGTDLESYIDVDAMLRYLAAHTIVVNLDSYSSNMAHNYYLYENDGKISMLPWDYNMAFGGFQSGNTSSIVNFPIDTPVSGVSMEDRPMISKLLEVDEYLERYHQYLQEILDGYFADGKFGQKVDNLNAMISAYVESDPAPFYTYDEHQAAVAEFKKLGTLRGESVQGQLNGSVPSTTEGQSAEPEKLIDASSIDMSALGSMGGGFDGMGGDFGGRGEMFGMDMSVLQQAMEIISDAVDGKLTDEQRAGLYDLGLTDEQIELMLTMPSGGAIPGGFVGRNGG